MKLFTEYMTRVEMAKAADAGQKGLRDIADAPRVNKISGPNMAFVNAKKKFDKQYGSRAVLIRRGSFNESVDTRLCLFHSGNFYAIDAGQGNHSLLVHAALFDRKLPKYITDHEALDVLWEWWEDSDTLSDFLCLYYDAETPTKMYLSESYADEEILYIMQNDEQTRNHYTNLVKKVFNKQLDVYYGF